MPAWPNPESTDWVKLPLSGFQNSIISAEMSIVFKNNLKAFHIYFSFYLPIFSYKYDGFYFLHHMRIQDLDREVTSFEHQASKNKVDVKAADLQLYISPLHLPLWNLKFNSKFEWKSK